MKISAWAGREKPRPGVAVTYYGSCELHAMRCKALVVVVGVGQGCDYVWAGRWMLRLESFVMLLV